MKIQKLTLTNFRSYQYTDVKLDAKSTVLFGWNGAGKSSFLDAIAILLSKYITNVRKEYITTNTKNTDKRVLEIEDIRVNQTESEIEVGIITENKSFSYGLSRQQRSNKEKLINSNQLEEWISDLQGSSHENSFNLPVIVFYDVHRAVLDIPTRIRTKHDFSPFSIYENALTGRTDFRVFFEWFRDQEDLENEIKIREKNFNHEDSQLKSVRDAIYQLLPRFKNLRVNRNPNRMLIDKEIGNDIVTLEVNQLSDGEKCMLALVGDLARRLALANPSSLNPLYGEGVVMIDEIELHLHPDWQREIIPRLQIAFPNIQFVVTTHSPQVLGEVRNMEILCLQSAEEGTILTPFPNVFGKDSNFILETTFQSESRDKNIKEQLSQLFRAISDQNWEDAKQLQQHLQTILGYNEPELVKADILFRRKRSLGQ